MTERKIARGEGIIVWFQVISADFFQQCAEQSQLLLSSVGMENHGPFPDSALHLSEQSSKESYL